MLFLLPKRELRDCWGRSDVFFSDVFLLGCSCPPANLWLQKCTWLKPWPPWSVTRL